MPDQPPYPPPRPPYQPQPPAYQPGYPGQPPFGAPRTPGGGAPRKPWGLVVGALVLGLVVGGGAATGVVLATAGDPKDSDDYQALRDDLDEARASLDGEAGADDPVDDPTAGSATVTTDPAPSAATRDVEGWTVTEPVIVEDEVGDFAATMQVTNDTGAADIAFFKVNLTQGGVLVTEMSCADQEEGASEVAAGATVEISCLSLVDYVEDGWDAVDITYAF